MLFKIFLLLLSSVLIAIDAANVLKLESRIVGGFEIDIENVPWQVSLQTRGSHFCGGSIIAAKWILTAAHCTTSPSIESNPNLITIKSGNKSYLNGTETKVKKVINHPWFSRRTIDFDYALIELQDELEFGETRRAIELAEARDRYIDGSMCLVSGWGDTRNFRDAPHILRGVEVPIVPQEKCSKAFQNDVDITDRMICAGFDKGGKDACHNDSGGPLVCGGSGTGQVKLVGVVSFGRDCAQPGFPGVYARVQSVREWISKQTGI